MKHEFLDRYGSLSSPIHRLDARAKLIGFFVAILVVVSEPTFDVAAFGLYFGLIGLIVLISRVPLDFLARRCLIAKMTASSVPNPPKRPHMKVSGTPIGASYVDEDEVLLDMKVHNFSSGLWRAK